MFGLLLQVFDSPHLKVLVGKRLRRRLDAKAIVQLLQSLDAPVGIIDSSPPPLSLCLCVSINVFELLDLRTELTPHDLSFIHDSVVDQYSLKGWNI